MLLASLTAVGCDSHEPETTLIVGVQRAQCAATSLSDILDTSAHRIDLSNAAWTLGTEGNPLNQVLDAGFLPNGDVVLLSDLGKRLEVFDGATGASLAPIGRSGRGPGEFHQAFFVNIFSDGGIAIPDYQNRRVVFFTPDFRPGPVAPAPLASQGSTLALLYGGTEGGAIIMNLVTRAEQRILNSGISIEEAVDHNVIFEPSSPPDTLSTGWSYRATLDGFLMSGPPSRPDRSFRISGERIGWLETDGLSLSLYNSQDGSVSCIEWRGPVPATEALEPSSLHSLEMSSPEVRLRNETRRSDLLAALREDDLGPFHPPVFREMRVALDGSIVVQLGVTLPDTPPAFKEYVRFSRDGKVVDRLQLPTGYHASVLATSDVHILLAWRGQFDVEYVAAFPLPS